MIETKLFESSTHHVARVDGSSSPASNGSNSPYLRQRGRLDISDNNDDDDEIHSNRKKGDYLSSSSRRNNDDDGSDSFDDEYCDDSDDADGDDKLGTNSDALWKMTSYRCCRDLLFVSLNSHYF